MVKNVCKGNFDKRRKNVMLLDVESIGTVNKTAYDIAFIVCNSQGDLLYQSSTLVKQIFCDQDEMSTAYYHKKNYNKYLCQLSTQETYIKPLKAIIDEMRKVALEYNVKEFLCYNTAFDVRSLVDTCIRYKVIDDVCYTNTSMVDFTKTFTEKILQKDVKVSCLWHTFCDLMKNNEDYKKFCKDNGFVSKAGNYQTSAEVAFKYISGNLEYDEPHQGLGDLKTCELSIYKYLQSYGCKMLEINQNCWQLLREKKAKVVKAKNVKCVAV